MWISSNNILDREEMIILISSNNWYQEPDSFCHRRRDGCGRRCGGDAARSPGRVSVRAGVMFSTACHRRRRCSACVAEEGEEGRGVAEARCRVHVMSRGRSGGHGGGDDGSYSYNFGRLEEEEVLLADIW